MASGNDDYKTRQDAGQEGAQPTGVPASPSLLEARLKKIFVDCSCISDWLESVPPTTVPLIRWNFIWQDISVCWMPQ